MKKILGLTFVMVFAISAVSVFACGNDNGSAKVKSSANTEMKQIQASMNTAEGKAQTAKATAGEAAGDMTKIDQASTSKEMVSDKAKAMKSEMKTTDDACSGTADRTAQNYLDGKDAKVTTAENKVKSEMKSVAIKAEEKVELK